MMDMDKINAELLKEGYDDALTGISDLIGHKIVDIGLVKADVVGGLTIDYADEDKIKRIILGFTELGIWVDWHGIKGKLNNTDILRLNIEKLYNDYHDFRSNKYPIDDDSYDAWFKDPDPTIEEYSISDFCEITVDDLIFYVKYLDVANIMHEFDINIKDLSEKQFNPKLRKLLGENNKDWNEILGLLRIMLL